MPMHDWTRVDAGAFHDFRSLWVAELVRVLNAGLLPSPILAIPEGEGIAVRHESGKRNLAEIAIVSPTTKSSAAALDAFLQRVQERLAQRVHLLVLDCFPPGPHDPSGVHGLIWNKLGPNAFHVPEGRPLVFVAYECGANGRAFPRAFAVGDVLPNMPLFVSPGACFELALEATYEAAFGKLKLPARG